MHLPENIPAKQQKPLQFRPEVTRATPLAFPVTPRVVVHTPSSTIQPRKALLATLPNSASKQSSSTLTRVVVLLDPRPLLTPLLAHRTISVNTQTLPAPLARRYARHRPLPYRPIYLSTELMEDKDGNLSLLFASPRRSRKSPTKISLVACNLIFSANLHSSSNLSLPKTYSAPTYVPLNSPTSLELLPSALPRERPLPHPSLISLSTWLYLLFLKSTPDTQLKVFSSRVSRVQWKLLHTEKIINPILGHLPPYTPTNLTLLTLGTLTLANITLILPLPRNLSVP